MFKPSAHRHDMRDGYFGFSKNRIKNTLEKSSYALCLIGCLLSLICVSLASLDSIMFPVTMMSAPADAAAIACSLVLIPPPTIRWTSRYSLTRPNHFRRHGCCCSRAAFKVNEAHAKVLACQSVMRAASSGLL